MRRLTLCLAVLGLVAVLGSTAHAQGFMRGGGWAPGFGNQGFFGPASGGFYSTYGYRPYGYGGGYPPYGTYGGYNPYYGAYSPYGAGLYSPPPLTVNMMGPLMRTIRQNTGRRRGGW